MAKQGSESDYTYKKPQKRDDHGMDNPESVSLGDVSKPNKYAEFSKSKKPSKAEYSMADEGDTPAPKVKKKTKRPAKKGPLIPKNPLLPEPGMDLRDSLVGLQSGASGANPAEMASMPTLPQMPRMQPTPPSLLPQNDMLPRPIGPQSFQPPVFPNSSDQRSSLPGLQSGAMSLGSQQMPQQSMPEPQMPEMTAYMRESPGSQLMDAGSQGMSALSNAFNQPTTQSIVDIPPIPNYSHQPQQGMSVQGSQMQPRPLPQTPPQNPGQGMFPGQDMMQAQNFNGLTDEQKMKLMMGQGFPGQVPQR